MELIMIWNDRDVLNGENAVEKPFHSEIPKYVNPKNRMESVLEPNVALVTPSLHPNPLSVLPQHQSQRDTASQRSSERRNHQRQNSDGIAVDSVLVEERHAPHLAQTVQNESQQNHEDQQMHTHQLFAVGAAAIDPHKKQNREKDGHDFHKWKQTGGRAGKMPVGTYSHHLTREMNVVHGGIANTKNYMIIIVFGSEI